MSTKSPAPAIPSLIYITLADIIKHFKSGTLTSAQLVHAYLTRIAEVDNKFHSIIELNPTALAEAEACDAVRTVDPNIPSHYGLPILLKDNIPTLDATNTTCGSLALVGARPKREAAIVTAMKKAGFIILGKANMAEWSGFRSTSGCSGWSARGGQTYGPYVKGSKASGSSSGSAVATALGLCFAALGTETCWSIVSPAEKSGIVGYKPTKGLLPSEGIMHASKKQDTVGVLARTVEDAQSVASLIIADSLERTSVSGVSGITQREFLDGLKVSTPHRIDLRGTCIGVPLDLLRATDLPEGKLKALALALHRLEGKGAKRNTKVTIRGWGEYESLSQEERQIVLDTDMKIAINDYLADLEINPQNIGDLQDLIDFTKTCPEEQYPARNVAGLERAQATSPDSELYKAMVEKDKFFASCIQRTLDRHDCDVLLIPFLSPMLQTLAAVAGSPVLSVPLSLYSTDSPIDIDVNGLINTAPGIPFSVFIFGRASDDPSVLKVGHAIETLMDVKGRLMPYVFPKAEVSETASTHISYSQTQNLENKRSA